MQHLARHLRHWGGLALDLLLPPTCLACDTPVEGDGQFCAACFGQTYLISATGCRSCGAPLAQASPWGVQRSCPACAAHAPAWSEARAVMRYDAQSKRVILALKHSDRPELARGLGVMMARAGADVLRHAHLLVPVPLHPARLRARRYNQAALLARAVGRVSGVAVLADALVRMRPTQPLGELSAEQRARVVEGAFAVRRGRSVLLAGQRVVLVDDVLTSGATATGCTQALLAAGAARVDVLVAARVPDPRGR